MTRAFLMSTHITPDGDTEAEPVIVELESSVASLLLDDGTKIHFDAAELREALSLPSEMREAA